MLIRAPRPVFRGVFGLCQQQLQLQPQRQQQLAVRMLQSNAAKSELSNSLRRIAVCQVTSSSNKDENFDKCSKLIVQAKQNGAKVVFLPECVDFVGERREHAWELAEPLDGPLLSRYRKLAADNGVWISLGSLHVRPSASSASEQQLLSGPRPVHAGAEPGAAATGSDPVPCSRTAPAAAPPTPAPAETASVESTTKSSSSSDSNNIRSGSGGGGGSGQEAAKKIRNTHVLIDDSGRLAGTYDKVHLFDVDIPTFRIKESDFALRGGRLTPPVDTPAGRVGLAICYDMRFAELALSLARSGAQILTYPSAFTVSTGYAHWEALLRARAIETQCYVVAAAQIGQHNAKRSSYGHSIVIDPWGAVVAQASEKTNHVIYADLDLAYLEKVRQGMPVWNHRRPDLYGEPLPVYDNKGIDSQETYQFGQFTLHKSQLFHKTALSMAFVNKMPVLPGHVLVAPLRPSAVRLADLTPEEMTDLMYLVDKAQKAVELEFDAKDSTISLQDGVLAGRSVDHLHLHILPRHVGDFKVDNDIYTELQDPAPKKRVRSIEEMAEEATRLRKYFE